MKPRGILLILSILFILTFLGSAYAEDNQMAPQEEGNINNNEYPPQTNELSNSSKEVVISGKVNDCITKDPFSGVDVTITKNGDVIASNITKEDGSYNINFLSNYNIFEVTASHIGHNSVTKEVNISSINENGFGMADFELGTVTQFTTVYVNKSVNNDNYDGSSPFINGTHGPKQKISSGISVTLPGGELYIVSGTYKEHYLKINSNITISNYNGGNVIVDGDEGGAVFLIYGGNNVTIQNLTIQNGDADDDEKDFENYGGAVYNKGNINLINCVLHDNKAYLGGAIYTEGNLTLQSCKLYKNQAKIGSGSGRGGAIYNPNTGTINITDCEIYDNHAADGNDDHNDGRDGGAIYNQGKMSIDDSDIHDNRAGDGNNRPGEKKNGDGGSGGAIYNIGSLTIRNTKIRNNTGGDGGQATQLKDQTGHPGGHGGAIFTNNTLIIQDCTFENNTAGKGGDSSGDHDGNRGGYGGAIFNDKDLAVENCTFTINNAGDGGDLGADVDASRGGAGGNGGAIYTTDKVINIINSTFNNNKAGNGHHGGEAGNGGAIYTLGVLQLQNCTLIGNIAGSGGACNDQKEGQNGGYGGAIYSKNTLNLTNCTLKSNKAGNGGDSGDKVGGDGGYGGAIYNTYNLTIESSIFEGNFAGEGGKSSDVHDGRKGGYGGTLFITGTSTISNSTIKNGGAGKGGNVENAVKIDFCTAGDGGKGGAIYNQGILTIYNCIFENNTAGHGGDAAAFPAFAGKGGDGGAIYSTNTTNINDTKIRINKAGKGGKAIAFISFGSNGGDGGSIYNTNALNISNCDLTDNSAGNGGDGDKLVDFPGKGGDGGAIYNTGNLNIGNTTMFINHAGIGGLWPVNGTEIPCGNGGDGGAIYNNGKLTIHNSGFRDNFAGIFGLFGHGGYGGAIYNLGFLEITESELNHNIAGTGIESIVHLEIGEGKGNNIYSDTHKNVTVSFCRIVDYKILKRHYNVYLGTSSSDNTVNLLNNWWGTNDNPKDQIFGNNITSKCYNPWLVLSIITSKSAIYANQSTSITANLIMDCNGTNTLKKYAMYVPDLIPVHFEAILGSLEHEFWFTYRGASNNRFYADAGSGIATVNATVDNQTVNITITVNPSADIQVIKTVNNTRPNVGDFVTFTVEVINNGPDNATNIQVTDKFPGSFLLISTTVTNGTYSGNVWNISSLANGQYAYLQYVAQATEIMAGLNTTNTATKTKEDQYDPNPHNDQSSATVYVPLFVIQLTKTVDNNKPNVGQTIKFTVTAKNNGPDNASNVQITDNMPAGFDNVHASYSSGTTYQNGVWTISQLFNGAIVTLNLTGTVNSSISGINTTNTANKSNASASATIYVPVADIYISKTVNKNNPNVGDVVIFTVTAVNDGPDDATNIQITDFMPAGFDNVQIIPSSGTYNNTTGIWYIPLLENGKSAFLNLSGNINSTIASQTVTNTANKTYQDQYDSVPDNTASASINVQEADIQITKTSNKQTANVGENVIFTIKVTNKGPDQATGLIFIDKLPAGLKYNSASADKYLSVYHIGNYILWELGNLTNSENATLIINATVIAPGNQTNIVRKMHEDQYDNDTDFANATVYAPQADVMLVKTVTKSTVNVGDKVTFTVTVKNNGPDNATNIQITDIIPAGFNNITFTNSSGNYNNISGIWTIPNLANGTNATLTLSGIVNSTIAGINTTNTANKTHQDQYDPNPNNNSASAIIYVLEADVHISKTADKNNPNVGDVVTFTVKAVNDGPDDATNIQITDAMPAGFNNVTYTYSNGTTYSNGIWTIPLLKYGASAFLNLSGIVKSSIVNQTVTNTATKTYQDQYDSVPDNTASASINVQEADIQITKTVDKIKVNVGDNVIFTITATNKGPDPATGLIFIDKMPVGLIYNSASADKGNITYSPNYITWDLGSLNNTERATLTINTTVNSVKTMINMVRKVHEDQYDSDVDFATAIIYVLEADVSLTNTPNNSTLNVGDNATFTVIARNNGPNNATNVLITDLLPSGFTAYVNKGEFNNGIWNIGTLGRNEEAILNISGIITPDWAGKAIYNNITETQDEYNCYPQTVWTNIYVPLANMTITKVARPINFNLNDAVRYLIILDNQGPDVATGIVVIDQSPNDLEFESASDNGIYDSTSETIYWNLNELSNGLYKVLILKEKVKPNISNNIITNTATESQNEYNFEFKSSSETITINKAELYIISSIDKSNIQLGETFTVTFKLGNKGPNTAKHVLVSIPIPDGLEFVTTSLDQGTWNYDPSTKTFTWDLGDVEVGDPYLYMILKAIRIGNYVITPIVSTSTYDPNLNSSIIPINIEVIPVNKSVKDTGKTIRMQKTGLPLAALLLAILVILAGLSSRKIKI